MPLKDRFAALLIRGRWVLLAAAAALTAAATLAPQVQWTRSVESMFAPDDPLLAPYRLLRDRFGGNQVVLAVFDVPGLLDPSGQHLQAIAAVSEELRQAEGVGGVLSISQLDRLLALRPGSLFKQITGDSTSVLLNSDDPMARRTLEVFDGYTHGMDGQAAAIACLLDPQADLARAVTAIGAIVANPPAGLRPGYMAGEPVMVHEGFSMIERDGAMLGWASTWLLGAVVALMFRRLAWVAITLLVVQASLLWTRAAASGLDLRLSLVSSILAALVTVIGVATVIHLIVRLRDGRSRGLSQQQALQAALAALIGPIFWACATDALAFLALTFSSVAPVQDFGWMMALGAMMVFLAIMLLTPALSLLPWADPQPSGRGDAWLKGRLQAVLHRIQQHAAWWLAGSLAMVVILSVGSWRLQVESDFTRNFRADTPLVQAYAWIEQRLSGAGVLEVLVTAPDGVTEEFLQRLLSLEEDLRQLRDEDGRPLLTKVVSMADAEQAARLDPLLARLPLTTRLAAIRQALPTFGEATLADASDGRPAMIRVMLRALERQDAHRKQHIIAEVRRVAEAAFPGPPPPEVTGAFVLLTNMIDSLLSDQWTCFGISAVGIVAMMCVAFRSWRLALIALVPNALPILVTMGALGWLGMRMNMGAAMIAAVSMGLSVDSSIHYLTVYHRARLRGDSLASALQAAHATVGSAMIYAMLALVAGFLVLCFSQFIPTVYFGALVSLAMLGGLAGNLLVLPLLLRMTEPR